LIYTENTMTADKKNLLLPAGIHPAQVVHNADSAALITLTIQNGQGCLADNGALMIDTGHFTGRAPDDKYTVRDGLTEETVWWDANHSMSDPVFYQLLTKMSEFCNGKKLYVQDVFACAAEAARISVRVISTLPSSGLFVNNMFLNPSAEELEVFEPAYTILQIPEFEAIPEVDGIPRKNFAILNLSRRMILIGGTGYTGEMKKGIFTVLNFLLPLKGVLSMHCSANVGKDGKSAIYFGLSGTGKTTLSADPERGLIGDDEHGWDDTGIYNFEGGCYAKVINLSQKNEPEIYNAIRFGALLENVCTVEGTSKPDYTNTSKTLNTRVSYPLDYIPNAVIPSVGSHPENIFFLTCDALGVLTPIARLNPAQDMFHFVSGYTARIAGTEMGIVEPKTVFSACFGAPFLALHPMVYAKLLAEKMQKHQVNVYLISTGWTGGAYGEGSRISIPNTRAIISAALEGKMNDAKWETDPTFGFEVPNALPGVDSAILKPRETWVSKEKYDQAAKALAQAFLDNIAKYAVGHEEILAGGPLVSVIPA
jgi:phosphoenolpyruvate carboxykinase (ATP)